MTLITNNCLQSWHAKLAKQPQNCLSRTIMTNDDFIKLIAGRDKVDLAAAAFSVQKFNVNEIFPHQTNLGPYDGKDQIRVDCSGLAFWLIHRETAGTIEDELEFQKKKWLERAKRAPDQISKCVFLYHDYNMLNKDESKKFMSGQCKKLLDGGKLVYVTHHREVKLEAEKNKTKNVLYFKRQDLKSLMKQLLKILVNI